MTKEEIKHYYSLMDNVDYSEDYKYFNENYSIDVLSKLKGMELAVRLFANADYGDTTGVRGYFCWAEHGSKGRPPFGTAKIDKTRNIQYNGEKFYLTENGEITDVDDTQAFICAENIKQVFIAMIKIVDNYISQNKLNAIADYRSLNNELLNLVKNTISIEKLNEKLIFNTNGLTSYVIKYFHCRWKDYFAFWYGRNSLIEIFNKVLDEEAVEDSLVLNGRLSLVAKELAIDNDSFGVLMDKLKDKLEKDKATTTKKEENDTKGYNMHELNLILYGPPGTGKTYSTVIKAVEIIDGNNANADASVKSALTALKNNSADKAAYKIVLKRYRELLKAERIAFTTFHQSYGYEEFIEGIKPILDEDDVKYDVLPGVFKKFCDNAKKLKTEVSTNYGFNSSPTVWKVSLEGTGDNPTRRDCLANNRIRIGWESYGKNLDNGAEIKDGKNVLGAFLNKMQIGDIVLSCYSATTIDAIGVVTGEYEWLDESFSPYRRARNVKWLAKGIRENIVQLNNGKAMTLSAVHRLNVSVDDVVKILNRSGMQKGETVDYDYSTPYVFIIDEINRGNISKIFGELITLIEPSKRLSADEEMKCTLPYSGVPFGVPKNVYILGTMNTADRSLVQLDAALHRRFAFEEMMPRPDLLKPTSDGIDLTRLLIEINDRITVLLDREHQIGHSYFMDVKDVDELAYVFRQKIIPLLQEYFFDNYEEIEKVLSSKFIERKTVKIGGEEKVYYKILVSDNADDYISIYSATAKEATDNE